MPYLGPGVNDCCVPAVMVIWSNGIDRPKVNKCEPALLLEEWKYTLPTDYNEESILI